MTPEEVATWPHWLKRFAEVIGPERTLELAAAFGGLDAIYLPKGASERHLWLGVLSPSELAALSARFGGERIAIPRQAEREEGKKRKILELVGQGLSDREIAIRVHTTQRNVRKVRSAVGIPSGRSRKGDPRQLRLIGT